MAVQPIDPKTSSIGDRLWLDTNNNGMQDGGELGLSGVTVQLLDSHGNVVATTTSGTDGSYLFDHLAAGVYQVQFGNKDGYGFTRSDGSSIAMVDVYFTVADASATQAQPATIANKLAHLLQPADDLLHTALGHSAAEATAAAAAVNTDGGEVMRQMLANWAAHHATAA